MESSGAQVLDSFQTVHNAMVVRMSRDQANQLRSQAGVRSVRPVRMYHKLLDHALPLQKVFDAWQQVGGFDKAGAGVKIAIIDTGIDASHPGFPDTSLTAPAGFPRVNRQSDLFYTNGKIIVARAYTDPQTGRPYAANDVDGHGTGVAMIAAGGVNVGPHGPIAGVAPGAYLGNYKVFPDSENGAPDSLIIRAIEDAVNDGMDVINLSLGSFPATRPQDDSLVSVIENAAAVGKVVTIAVGNDGSVPNTISSPATAPSAIAAGSSHNDRIFAARVLIEGRDPYTALPDDSQSPSRPVTGSVTDITQFDPTSLGCGSYPQEALNGAIALISRGTCTFQVKLQNAQAAGAVGAILYARADSPDPFDFGAGGATLPAVMISNGDGLALRNDLGSGTLTASIDFTLTAAHVSAARISDFSSVGPSSDNSIKPDLLTIGQDIYTAKPVADGGYVVEDGTSFSAPTAAGAAALLIGAKPGLTAQQYRSLLVNSTSIFTAPDGATPLGVQSAGAGLLNVSAAVSNTVAASPLSLSFGIGGSTVASTQTLTLTNTGKAADTFTITGQPVGDGPAPSLAANTIQLDPGQSKNVDVQFAGDQLSGGVYQGFLLIQGTQTTVGSRVPYWFGVPSQHGRYFQLLYAPTTVRRGSGFDVEFRVLDANGIPVTQGITPSIVSGATVNGIDSSDYDIPGSFVVHVAAPAVRGNLAIQFQFDGVPAIDPVSIRVQ